VKAKGTIKSVCGTKITEGTVGVVLGHKKFNNWMPDIFGKLERTQAGALAVLWDGEIYGKVHDSFHNIVTCTH
jgi:hypothetical protein